MEADEVYEFPLPEWVDLNGCWLAVRGEVNIGDLVGPYRPGNIIRMARADSLRYVPPSSDDYARIAGMVSDAA